MEPAGHEKLTRRAAAGRRENSRKAMRRRKRTPPISPEPSGILTPHVKVDHPASNGCPLLDIGRLHGLTKRVLVTGVINSDLLVQRSKTSVGGLYGHDVCKVALKDFWKHFNALFPGYIQPSRAILNYVPVFREFFDRTTGTIGQRHGSRWTTENRTFYASLRRDPLIPFFETYTRGMLIHPALGLFPEKTAAVFNWTIPEPLTTLKFNGRRFTKDELNCSAFYPPLSRVVIKARNFEGFYLAIHARIGTSPCDEHGDPYLSVYNVLHEIRIWLSGFISYRLWKILPHSVNAALVSSSYGMLTKNQRITHAAIFSKWNDFVRKVPPTRSDYFVAREGLYDEIVRFDAGPFRTNIRSSTLLLGKKAFRGLANIGPNLYVLEVQ